MPSLDFVLPHWMYWLGLVAFPLLAMYMAKRQEARPPAMATSLPIAYLLLITAGFVGLHRLYVRSYLGILYIPLFVAILYGNFRERGARNGVSEARRDLRGAEFELENAQGAVEQATAGAAEALARAGEAMANAGQALESSLAVLESWGSFSLTLASIIAAFMLVDAVLLPRLARACRTREQARTQPLISDPIAEAAEPAGIRYPLFVRVIDGVNLHVGSFIAYWSVIAVFVYYYEVIARYVFNSPTNWAHESMFLMFGMQYLLAGGFALRTDSHVRVDVIYGMLSRRTQTVLDILSSSAFFIFTGVLLWTGAVFAQRSIRVMEVSITEWAIQYWPVKSMIAVGAFLLLIQGISKLAKDIHVLAGKDR